MISHFRFRIRTLPVALLRRTLEVLGMTLLSMAWILAFWPSAAQPQSAGAASAAVTVGQTNGGGATGVNQYNAAAITIAQGDTVTWNSAPDGKFHDVTSYEESSPGTPAWASPMLKSGTSNSSFSHVFAASGTFTYFCSLHASRAEADPAVVDANITAGKMVGKVTVQASATATPTSSPPPADTPTVMNTPPPGSTATNTPQPSATPTNTNTPLPSATATTTSTPTRTATPRPNTVTVEMTNFSFDPKNLTVRVGDTVRWVNNSGTPHTTASSGNWDSSIVASGSSFERTFNSTGTFNYRCDIHSDVQTGTITVQQDVSPTATTSAVVTPTAPVATPSARAAATDDAAPLSAAAAAARGPITVDVAMQDYLFSPATTTIAVGDTIRWVNKGNAPHNTTADGGAWSSKQLMNAGETFSFTFKSAGTYTYKCTLHAGQGQKGTVVVNAVAEGTLLPGAGDGGGDSGRIIRMLLATVLGLAGFCAVSASLWSRRPI